MLIDALLVIYYCPLPAIIKGLLTIIFWGDFLVAV